MIFLLRLVSYILLARLVLGLVRALGVGREPRRQDGPRRERRAAAARPPHLGDDIVDAEFEDLGPEKGS